MPYSDPDRIGVSDHVTHQSRFCSVFLLETSIFQGFEGIFGGALIEAYASFWPAVSIFNEIEINVTHNVDDVSFEMEDLTLEFHKNIATKIDNGAPEEGGMRAIHVNRSGWQTPVLRSLLQTTIKKKMRLI